MDRDKINILKSCCNQRKPVERAAAKKKFGALKGFCTQKITFCCRQLNLRIGSIEKVKLGKCVQDLENVSHVVIQNRSMQLKFCHLNMNFFGLIRDVVRKTLFTANWTKCSRECFLRLSSTMQPRASFLLGKKGLWM